MIKKVLVRFKIHKRSKKNDKISLPCHAKPRFLEAAAGTGLCSIATPATPATQTIMLNDSYSLTLLYGIS